LYWGVQRDKNQRIYTIQWIYWWSLKANTEDFSGNAQNGRRHRMSYCSLFTRKCSGTDVLLENNIKRCWQCDIYSSVWLLRKESPTKYSGLCRIENQFWYHFSILLKYKDQFVFWTKVSRKSSALYTEIFRHTLSPYCISTTRFPSCSWESNSDSRLLPHWLEHISLCISGDVFSYFEVPKRTLNGNKK
jgi:hypothetical protein